MSNAAGSTVTFDASKTPVGPRQPFNFQKLSICLQSCAAPRNRKEANGLGNSSQCFSTYAERSSGPDPTAEEQSMSQHQLLNHADLPFLYQGGGQAASSALQSFPMEYAHSMPPASTCYPANQPQVAMPASANFHGLPHIDQPYCYGTPGLQDVDFHMGRLCQARTLPDLYRGAGASQSIDSDGTTAGHHSRPTSSEAGQDFKAAPEPW